MSMRHETLHELKAQATRRTFLGATAAASIGSTALAALLGEPASAGGSSRASGATGSTSADSPSLPHFAPKAKRVLCLFQCEGFSHVDLFDHKPTLQQISRQGNPASVKGTQRLTGMTCGQSAYPVVRAVWPGRRCGEHGTWISDLLPHMQTIADDMCIIKSMHTEAINHDPAITYMNTGNQQPGYAEHGRVGQLRPGQREREPADVHRDGLARLGQEPGPADLLATVGQRLPAVVASRRRPAAGANPVLYLERPAGHRSRRSGARCSTTSPQLNHLRAPRTGRSRNARADQRLRDGVPHADVGAGADRHQRRVAGDARDLRSRGGKAGQLRRELPARPPAARARRAVRAALPPRLGSAHRDRAAVAEPMPRRRSADRGAHQRPASSAGCSKTRSWSSPPSSAARSSARASSATPAWAATIMAAASPSGWPAPA